MDNDDNYSDNDTHNTYSNDTNNGSLNIIVTILNIPHDNHDNILIW